MNLVIPNDLGYFYLDLYIVGCKLLLHGPEPKLLCVEPLVCSTKSMDVEVGVIKNGQVWVHWEESKTSLNIFTCEIQLECPESSFSCIHEFLPGYWSHKRMSDDKVWIHWVESNPSL